jgi:hypothetical protein
MPRIPFLNRFRSNVRLSINANERFSGHYVYEETHY